MKIATSKAVSKNRPRTPKHFDLANTFAPALSHTAHANPHFRQQCRRIHTHEPRIMGELIAHRLNADAWLNERLNAYVSINPQTVEALSCDDCDQRREDDMITVGAAENRGSDHSDVSAWSLDAETCRQTSTRGKCRSSPRAGSAWNHRRERRAP